MNPKELHQKRNQFGLLSKEYDKGRRGYPNELFKYLKKLTGKRKIKILDVGCGTGIATRQLHEHGFDVVGVDKDATMIKTANKYNSGINYFVSRIDSLPFKDQEFDVVTAFTAFHWFTDAKSVREIKRVIKNNGLFFTVIKQSPKKVTDKRNNPYQIILRKYVGNNFDSAKNYHPEKVLGQNGFKSISKKIFTFKEAHTLKEALLLIQSLSYWNLVRNSQKSKLLGELEAMYRRNLVKGKLIRNREAQVAFGYKRK